MVHLTFDPWAYNQDGGLQTEVDWSKVSGVDTLTS